MSEFYPGWVDDWAHAHAAMSPRERAALPQDGYTSLLRSVVPEVKPKFAPAWALSQESRLRGAHARSKLKCRY